LADKKLEVPAAQPSYRIPLGPVIKAWRIARNLTQAELAERIREAGGNATPGYVSNLERHIRSPQVERLEQVAKALDIPPEHLVLRVFPTENLNQVYVGEGGTTAQEIASTADSSTEALTGTFAADLQGILAGIDEIRAQIDALLARALDQEVGRPQSEER
jgi:transcriptional regulator with XRE-family HTH domain